jgi:uncharacterized membrane protein (UPF0136 family)
LQSFTLAFGSLVWWLATRSSIAAFSGIVFGILSICVAATFSRTGRDRTILASCTAALAVVAVGAIFLTSSNNTSGHVFTVSFAFGFIGFQLIANALASRSR